MNKLLFGVCGIGRGHIYRQLPIISHFAQKNKIAIFTFKESFAFFSKNFNENKNVKIISVSVPWVHGSLNGIDYNKTAQNLFNSQLDYISLNFAAMDNAVGFLGNVDLVISDYEPTSIQLAYSLNAPCITIDQQSKYFLDGFPTRHNSLSIEEERARLRLFFPKADKRIACSFFKHTTNKMHDDHFKVQILPPVIREEITELKSQLVNNSMNSNFLVYISPYSEFVQTAKEVLSVLEKFPNSIFYLFVSKTSDFSIIKNIPDNVKIFFHGDSEFLNVISITCAAICTAGHTFISEMMFLKKPVYAIPLQTYEQQYNAKIIQDNAFGICCSKFEVEALDYFINNINKFKRNIQSDKKILLNKSTGQKRIIGIIQKLLFTV